MNLFKKIFLILILSFSSNIFSQTLLRFKFHDGDQFKVESTVYNKITSNDKYHGEGYIKNNVFVRVEKKEGEIPLMNVRYQTLKVNNSDKIYQANRLKEEQEAVYSLDELGHEKIIKMSKLKNVENISILPEKAVKIGDTWTSLGKNYFPDIADKPIEIPVYVKYEYLGKKKYTEENKLKEYDDDYDLIRVSYNYLVTYPEIESQIKKIEGKVRMLIYFDNKIGRERYKEYQANITFLWQNKFKRNYRINSFSRTIDTKRIENKEEVIKILKNNLDQYGAVVKKTKEGLSVNIMINFQKDSSSLLEKEKSKLKKLAEVLSDKKFKNRNFLIKGHTSKFKAVSQKQHIKLSQARADAVANYLLKNKILEKKQVLTLGLGSKEPLYPDDDKANASKNRRVEILILDN